MAARDPLCVSEKKILLPGKAYLIKDIKKDN